MTLLGYGATKNNASQLDNGIAIGSGAQVLASNQAVLGNDNITTTLLKGSVGIGTTTPSVALDITSDIMALRTAKTPASATDNGTTGSICWDSGYVYVCVGLNAWKRAALVSW